MAVEWQFYNALSSLKLVTVRSCKEGRWFQYNNYDPIITLEFLKQLLWNHEAQIGMAPSSRIAILQTPEETQTSAYYGEQTTLEYINGVGQHTFHRVGRHTFLLEAPSPSRWERFEVGLSDPWLSWLRE